MKGFLSAKGVDFTDHNVMDDPAALEEVVRRTGARAVPVVMVGDEVVVGFDRGKLQRLLEIS
ncbi:MAG: glutaredoxin domain-containing protein [bacterium]|nr:glutaredoxin domain-containing protein [bacterium]MDV2504065.1 glutaredoxin domain-containing protein [bacterium]